MNAIEKLKELETRALDGRQDINLQAIAEDVYADALRRIGSEIIAHWEAGLELGRAFNALHASYGHDGEEGPESEALADKMHEAFTNFAEKQNKLNAKTAEVLP